MQISSVSNQNSNQIYCSTKNNATSASAKAVQALQRQKMQLQEQIQNIAQEKLDPKEKTEKQKEIQDQIDQIDAQIAEIQAQAKEEEMEKAQAKQETEKIKNSSDPEQEKSNSEMKNMFEAASGYSDIGALNKLRVKLKGEIGVGNAEIKTDAGKRNGPSKVTINNVAQETAALSGVASKMANKFEYVSKKVDEAREVGIAEAKAENKKKTKENQKTEKSNNTTDDNTQINTDSSVQEAVQNTDQKVDDTKNKEVKGPKEADDSQDHNKDVKVKVYKSVDVRI